MRRIFPNKEETTPEKKQEENTEKIKRFDDIFRMLLLVITIVLSARVGNVNLWNNLGVIFLALALWMFGHAYGMRWSFGDIEIWFKLYAWAITSFIGSIILIKVVLLISIVSWEWVIFSSILSICITIPPLYWFRKMLNNYQKRGLLILLYSIAQLSYFVYMGYISI